MKLEELKPGANGMAGSAGRLESLFVFRGGVSFMRTSAAAWTRSVFPWRTC
jgi:hypothetical protein